MIEIIKQTIEAIESFDIAAAVNGLRKDNPNMSEGEIQKIISEKLTYLGSGELESYKRLYDGLRLRELDKKLERKRIHELLTLILIEMFKEAIGTPTKKLVDRFNEVILEQDLKITTPRP